MRFLNQLQTFFKLHFLQQHVYLIQNLFTLFNVYQKQPSDYQVYFNIYYNIQIYMQESIGQLTTRPQFKQAQLSLGLKKQFFDAKFVYSQQQNSNPDAFLIPLRQQLPSQICGFTYSQIQYIHALSAQMIHEAAKSLQVPICTEILSQTIFHFFFARKSFIQYDIRDIMIGCMFLACKSEETLKKRYQIIMVFDYIFKVYQQDKRIAPLQIGSSEYEYLKEKTIIQAQIDILFELGFEIYKLFDVPHRYISTVLNLFDKHPKYNQICQNAWKILNDCYRSLVCLYYPSQNICAAAIYMSMRQCNAKFPEVPWWTLLQCTEENIINIQCIVLNLKNHRNKLKFLSLSNRIQQIGSNCNIQNVFPVPYFRKIMLQKRNKLRISKKSQQNPSNSHKQIQIQQNFDHKVKQDDNSKQQKNGKVSQQQQKNLTEKVKNQTLSQIKQDNKQQKKSVIDKKNLLANISQKLMKHEAVVRKKVQQKNQQPKSSDSQNQDEQDIAQLRRKIKQKKQLQKDVVNKQ